jgi:uncharacterized RDD family membrane protein YckC
MREYPPPPPPPPPVYGQVHFEPAPPPRYGSWLLASWGYRAGAIGIDMLITVALGVAAWGLARLGGEPGTTSVGFGILAIFFGWILLMAIAMGTTPGQSIGKRVTSIHVVRENGQPAGFWWSIMRDTLCRGLFFFIPFAILVDYLFATGAKRQTLHDKMTSTHVVQGPSYAARKAPAIIGGITGIAAVIGVFVAYSVVHQHERLGNGYSVAERDVFVHGCVQGDGSRRQCECVFDYIKDHMPHDRYVEISRAFERDPQNTHLPKEFLTAGDRCLVPPGSPPDTPGSDTPEGA